MGRKSPPEERKLKFPKKTRRSNKYVKSEKNKSNKVTVIGINCNGLSGKRDSMTANLELLKPSIFFIQETKFMKKGSFKAKDYEIFENIRPSHEYTKTLVLFLLT